MPLALVTGAGIRVGAAIAHALADDGFDLILHAHRSVASLEQVSSAVLAKGRKAWTVSADLSLEDAPAKLLETVKKAGGTLDLLVNNAGIFEKVPFAEIAKEAYRRMQAINLEAPFFLTQALLPSLKKSDQACVVNITDIGGERPVSEYAHYSVSKAGLLMLTRALAVELAPAVRVNAVSPGTVAFPENFTEEERQHHLRRVPMAREGKVEDVAQAVAFLAKAPYVTGQVLAIDGGRSARL